MFEVAGGPGRFFSVAAAATAFLHGHDFVEAIEVDIENACKLATVEQVCESGSHGPEYTGAEAHAHIIVIHLVLLLPAYHVLLQKCHQVEQYLLVQRRQLIQHIQDK